MIWACHGVCVSGSARMFEERGWGSRYLPNGVVRPEQCMVALHHAYAYTDGRTIRSIQRAITTSGLQEPRRRDRHDSFPHQLKSMGGGGGWGGIGPCSTQVVLYLKFADGGKPNYSDCARRCILTIQNARNENHGGMCRYYCSGGCAVLHSDTEPCLWLTWVPLSVRYVAAH